MSDIKKIVFKKIWINQAISVVVTLSKLFVECFCQKILLKITTRISLSVIIIHFQSSFLLKMKTFSFSRKDILWPCHFYIICIPIYLFDSKCIFRIRRNQSRNIIEMQYFLSIFVINQ